MSEGRKTRPSPSSFAVLPPPTPGAGQVTGSLRRSRPPELPAGKRGGLHHDSVYPRLASPPLPHGQVNFGPDLTSRPVTLLCGPMPRRYVAVCGASEATPSQLEAAGEIGRLLAEAGAIVINGGLGGVSGAASEGAAGAGGLVVGLLPDAHRAGANPFLTVA